MSVPSTGWFRRHRREAPASPPAYPRIAAHDTTVAPTEFDLFAFDQSTPPRWAAAHVTEIVPASAVSERDVLWLAVQAAWPVEHPLARALATAWQDRTDTAPPSSTGNWHISAGRGLQGYLHAYQVLIGTEQLMRDGGISLPESIRATLETYVARGWEAVFVGARSAPAERADVHCSLIGMLAVAPDAPPPAAIDETRESAPPSPVSKPAQPPAGRHRRRTWPALAVLATLIAIPGVYESALKVEPSEVAIISRFGRPVAVCGPGMHLRPLWLAENVTRIQPFGTRLLHLEWGGDSTDERHLRAAVEYRVGETDADRITYASAPSNCEALLTQLAAATLRDALAAPRLSALSVDWQRRLNERLEAVPLGITVVNTPIFVLDADPATAPSEAVPDRDLVAQAKLEAKKAIDAAQAEARKTVAEAFDAATEVRTAAAAEATSSAEAALEEAGLLLERCGGAGATLQTARLMLIREALDDRLPGTRAKLIDPSLGERCRIYILKGSGVLPDSLWSWPAATLAPTREGQP